MELSGDSSSSSSREREVNAYPAPSAFPEGAHKNKVLVLLKMVVSHSQDVRGCEKGDSLNTNIWVASSVPHYENKECQ